MKKFSIEKMKLNPCSDYDGKITPKSIYQLCYFSDNEYKKFTKLQKKKLISGKFTTVDKMKFIFKGQIDKFCIRDNDTGCCAVHIYGEVSKVL